MTALFRYKLAFWVPPILMLSTKRRGLVALHYQRYRECHRSLDYLEDLLTVRLDLTYDEENLPSRRL
ncbi:hypothetical protein CEXT_686641 [Caerostris extrusa]|uniref:Uncharacterized protein n=1 Tax=Caerostris extrusa TaxID=172846 RepID=A0AAV4QYA4_CAEEX|nr:hypothetical protein CEXT_686641 [Caerostris extrusa]